MPKRITYLTKRADLIRDEFREHWSTSHAAIAVGLPGVASYRQNHVTSGTDSRYHVDGIVELWFTDDEAVTAGIHSDVAELLIADEPRFLSGLVGGAVHSGGPTPHWPTKIWVLGRWAGEPRPEDAVTWAECAAEQSRAEGHAVNIEDVGGPQLTREALHVCPEPAQLAVCFGFSDMSSAVVGEAVIAASLTRLDGVEGLLTLMAEELVIV